MLASGVADGRLGPRSGEYKRHAGGASEAKAGKAEVTQLSLWFGRPRDADNAPRLAATRSAFDNRSGLSRLSVRGGSPGRGGAGQVSEPFLGAARPFPARVAPQEPPSSHAPASCSDPVRPRLGEAHALGPHSPAPAVTGVTGRGRALFSWPSFFSAGVQVSSRSTALELGARFSSGRASSSSTGSTGALLGDQTAPAWRGDPNSRPRTAGPGAQAGDSVAPLSALQHAFTKRFICATRAWRRDAVCLSRNLFSCAA